MYLSVLSTYHLQGYCILSDDNYAWREIIGTLPGRIIFVRVVARASIG